MPELTLVLLAAGMGSRYGGLKQLEPMGPGGETLMDYSVYDAQRAGFSRLVFVIRRDFEADFRAKVASKYAGRLAVDLAFQSLDDLPGARAVPAGRVKPWGTGHALRAARHAVRGPFAVVNADDFYGRDGLQGLAQWLLASREGQAAAVTYPLGATLSSHGTVSRGVCAVEGGRLASVTERLRLSLKAGTGWDEDAAAPLALETPVSLNLFGFQPGFMRRLDDGFERYLAALDDPSRGEYQLPTQVNLAMQAGLEVHALACGRRWFGITYPEDRAWVQGQLRGLVEAGDYPPHLF
jgi:hypothetical protein